ncbi:hypothetical protein [Rhizobium sullae]|uniref:Glyoxalase/bleomycin resistance/dioxygenase family protein n=1 Tax=Rhizobium sullae TaxID=50338 RepID=A0A4R3Q5D5_RHISU|nr:hypothetical protein [Rhizobium sullae]TCU15694.1 hypothetical protein EV132_10633 [Rhizobium sullae]
MTELLYGGVDVAMKVPPHQYRPVLSFYRDVVRLKEIGKEGARGFELGPIRLWIDEAPAMSQAELWLELFTPDFGKAAEHLAKAGVPRCDPIEALPEDFRGGWILNPANIVHLVREADAWEAPSP